jgi:hypothetical protein
MPFFAGNHSKISANVGLFANFPNAAHLCYKQLLLIGIVYGYLVEGNNDHGNTNGKRYS